MPGAPVPSPEGNLPRTADGRPLELTVSNRNLRDLAEVLKPGTILTGRVIEQFANGDYLLTLRGRNLVAGSQIPLLRDSVVRLQVDRGSGEGMRLVLLAPEEMDAARTSAPRDRLRALDITPNRATLSALQAFEQMEAPLDKARVMRCAVATAEGSGEPIAHALLAKYDLPVTPVLLALAARAGQPGLPAAGRILTEAAGLAGSPPAGTAPAGSPATGDAVLSLGAPAPTADGQTPHPPSPAPPVPPATVRSPTFATPAAGPAYPDPVSSAPVPGGCRPAAGADPVAPPPRDPTPGASGQARRHHTGATALSVLAAGLPDLVRDGSEAAKRCLNLAGVRPAATSFPFHRPADGAGPAGDVPSVGDVGSRATVGQASAPAPEVPEPLTLLRGLIDLAGHLEPDGREVVHEQIRELAAETICKPASLADYELVLPLPLGGQQQATPARLAVSERRSGRQTGWFLRVDADLDRLGPVSLRMTDPGAGPMAITIAALPAALVLLRVGLSDLEDDLAARGLGCRVRLTDLSAEGRNDA